MVTQTYLSAAVWLAVAVVTCKCKIVEYKLYIEDDTASRIIITRNPTISASENIVQSLHYIFFIARI